MTKDSISLPSDEEFEQSLRFTTYLNYVNSIASYIGNRDYPIEITSSEEYKKIQCGKCSDFNKLGQLLRNAWFTEIQLSIPISNQEIIPYANHWLPVQAYYAIYLLLRAYFISTGRNVPNNHTTTLKIIGKEIEMRPGMFPLPLRVMCVEDPKKCKLINVPNGMTISPISNLRSWRNVNFWDSYALLLKTTRQRQFDENCSEQRRRIKKKRLTANEKEQCIKNLGPTSLFDFLYRLRLRSNYSDADAFLMGSLDNDEAKMFYKSLYTITWKVMQALETLIAKYITHKKYEEIIKAFSKYDSLNKSQITVSRRWITIKNLESS